MKQGSQNQNRLIDQVFHTNMKFFGLELECIDWIAMMLLLVLGLAARVALFDIESGDYVKAFADWMNEIQMAGGFAYIGITPGISDASTFDYNVLFQYLLCTLSLLHGVMKDMYLVKSLSVAFDFVAAITAFRILHRMTGSPRKGLVALGGVLLLPSVMLNSAAWAQNDSIYTAFLMLSFLAILNRRDCRSFVYLAIAFCFKQQAIFFLPFVLILWLKNRVKIRYILFLPLFYVLALIPAWIAGRPFGSLLGIYSNQVTMFSRLSMNYPSIYTIVTSKVTSVGRDGLTAMGILVTIMLLGILAYVSYQKTYAVTGLYMLTLAVFTIELITFCLPVMHERYAFVAEVFMVVYALYGYRRFVVAVGFQILTLITYSRYLFGSTVAYLYPLSAINLALILYVGYDLWQQMQLPEALQAEEEREAEPDVEQEVGAEVAPKEADA